jgi:proliferating cell nuclear antigen
MMKITQKRLAQFCGIVQALVPECRLMITDSGWNTMAVDTANVGMVTANMPAASFEEFKETDKTEIGMDVGKFEDMLRVMNDPKSTIEITMDSGRLRITDGKYTYTHTPLDANTVRKRPNPPNISLPSSVIIDAKEYHEVVKAMAVIGDKVRLEVDGERFELRTEGDTDALRKEIPTKPQDKKNGAAIASLFSIDYLKNVAKGMKDAGTITVHLGNEHPVRFDFEIDGIEASFLVAPRIEAD